jgi:dynamin 1-like protein
MEACYINTGHPDFLNGHKAIALVTERINNKQAQANADPKTSKNQLAALQTNNLSNTSVDGTDSNSFFGSFFSGAKKSKKGSMMETVIKKHVVCLC